MIFLLDDMTWHHYKEMAISKNPNIVWSYRLQICSGNCRWWRVDENRFKGLLEVIFLWTVAACLKLHLCVAYFHQILVIFLQFSDHFSSFQTNKEEKWSVGNNA